MLPLYIFEERYKLLVNHSLEGDRRIAISLLRGGAGGGSAPSRVCGLGEIVEVQELENGEKNIILKGLSRVALGEVSQDVPYIRARARVLEDVPAQSARSAPRVREITRLAQQVVFVLDPEGANRLINLLTYMKDPGFLTDFVSFYLLQDDDLKQELLEMLEVEARLERVGGILEEMVQSLER
jgi:ATP-dependent Lon protease